MAVMKKNEGVDESWMGKKSETDDFIDYDKQNVFIMIYLYTFSVAYLLQPTRWPVFGLTKDFFRITWVDVLKLFSLEKEGLRTTQTLPAAKM